jgi:cold shock CspA family protein
VAALRVEKLRMSPLVKWFYEKGFGFVAQDRGSKTFRSCHDLARSGLSELPEGRRVDAISQRQKGPEARSIELLD